MAIHLKTPDLTELKPKIAVIGVGGAGGNAVNNMIAANLEGVRFIAANTDAQALIHSTADTKIQLGVAMTEGLGAGSKPEIGAAAAEESIEEIRSHIKGLHMVFITAGMGGGTGTGAAPVIAAAARQEGVLTVGVVTKPFQFEGQRRMRSAEFGIELLAEQVDTLIVIPNQNLFKIAVDKTTFSEAFSMADQVLHDGISCITDVMVKEGNINLDFADVNLVMQGMGKAMMGTGVASGEHRGREAAEAAVSNPLLDDVTLKGAKGLLVSIIGREDNLTLYEVDEAANRVREEISPDANVIIGTAFDESLDNSIRVSVVATGLDSKNTVNAGVAASKVQEQPQQEAVREQSLQERLGQVGQQTSAPSKPPHAGQPMDTMAPPSVEAASSVPFGQTVAPANTANRENASDRQPATREGGEHMPGGLNDPGLAVRMPEIEDFPPVGQAVLRAHQSDRSTAGLETMKKRIGFLERLVDLASGRTEKRQPQQDVAEVPHVESQYGATAGNPPANVMDPHQKGGALSSAPIPQHVHSHISDEDTEFPSFLRKKTNP